MVAELCVIAFGFLCGCDSFFLSIRDSFMCRNVLVLLFLFCLVSANSFVNWFGLHLVMFSQLRLLMLLHGMCCLLEISFV